MYITTYLTSPVLDGGSESIIISHTIPDQSATSTSNDSSELLDITFREHRIYKEKLQMEALQQSIINDTNGSYAIFI